MKTTVWSALALSLVFGLLGTRNAQAQSCVAWVSGGSYTAGEVVTYNGATYTALVTQTDYVGTGWNPTIASLFTPGGSCSGGTSPPPPPPPPPAGITSGASYNVINPNSGLVLDVAGCGNVNGTAIDLWALGVNVCNGGSGQVWSPTLNSDGTYTLTNPASGLVLDVAGCGAANGTAVDLWANGVGVCDGGAGQKWAIDTNSDGTYTLVNPLTNNALDVSGCGTTNGTRVQTWANGVGVCDNGAGQKWQFVAATTSTPPASGSLPEHILVGYWQDFDNGAAVQTLASVPTTYNLIEVAFASADGALDGGITFSVDSGLAAAIPGGYTAAQFTSDIQTLHGQGRFVLLSVGGQNGSFALTSASMAANFANSAYALMRQYGFDGIDIDMENVITSANYTYVETALRQLSSMAGSKLIVTMAPQTIDMLPSFPTLDNYLQIARDLGSIITMVNTQYYNSGSMPGLNGVNYSEGSVDFITSQADAVLQYLSPGQVGLGLPASPSAAGGGYVSPTVVNAALDCLTQGINCGSYTPVGKYPSLRGAMDWSTNWDASNGNNFSNTVAPHLAALPK
jgi:chitinase